MPSFGSVGYVAVSDNDVALVKTKTGAFKMKISDKVLARAAASWSPSAITQVSTASAGVPQFVGI